MIANSKVKHAEYNDEYQHCKKEYTYFNKLKPKARVELNSIKEHASDQPELLLPVTSSE